MQQIMLMCRPGFEVEAGQELVDRAAGSGMFGYFQPVKNAGLARFTLGGPECAEDLMQKVAFEDLVFIRDWFIVVGDCELPATDRVGAVIEFLRDSGWAEPLASRVETRLMETNEDRDLGNFARKWVAPLSKGLRDAGLLAPASGTEPLYRLEVLLPDFGTAIIGLSLTGNCSPFPAGIPRLRLPALAPSRSALKLEEAWKVFLPPDRVLDYLGGGKKAVDLGAAPGGWTWQLVQQGMMVAAVDNGPMNADLMALGHVEHVRADGYAWRPKRPVDWMVCDIVDKPRRTARMALDWVGSKLCRYTVFNLKLPMKKRYEEWLICQGILLEGLAEAGVNCRLKARHLYHDREEITCFIERLD